MIKLQILKKGDQVIGITSEYIAVQRANKEVDILPMVKDESGLRVDVKNILTIGYGNNTVQAKTEDVTVITF